MKYIRFCRCILAMVTVDHQLYLACGRGKTFRPARYLTPQWSEWVRHHHFAFPNTRQLTCAQPPPMPCNLTDPSTGRFPDEAVEQLKSRAAVIEDMRFLDWQAECVTIEGQYSPEEAQAVSERDDKQAKSILTHIHRLDNLGIRSMCYAFIFRFFLCYIKSNLLV